jgi:hypothetical protein
MQGMDAILCKLYSGESHYQSFSKRNGGENRYLRPNQYFNLFGTMQEIHHYLDGDAFFDIGLARRTSIFYYSKSDLLKRERKPLLGRDLRSLEKQLVALGHKLGDYMNTVSDCVLMEIEDKAKEIINKMDMEYERAMLENEYNRYFDYTQGRVDQIKKFAMCRAIGRRGKVVLYDDIIKVKSLLETNKTSLESALSIHLTKDKKQHMLHRSKMIELIAKGKNHADRLRYFYKTFKMTAKDVNPLYYELRQDKIIRRNDDANGEYDYVLV